MPEVLNLHRGRDANPEAGPTYIVWTETPRLWIGSVLGKARFRATVDGGMCVMRDYKVPGKVAGPIGDCVFWAWSRLVAETDGSQKSEPKRRAKRAS